jgi:hypothetical protein
MPRNSNGTYSLPSGNPVVGGTYITTAWANPTMDDLAAAITDSLSRSGSGGMQVPFKNVDGSVVSPGITWVNELNTGFYRIAAQDMRLSVGGFDRQRWTATGVQLWDGTAWSNVQTALTLATSLTGYPLKAGNETISGTWTFSMQASFTAGLTAAAITGTSLSINAAAGSAAIYLTPTATNQSQIHYRNTFVLYNVENTATRFILDPLGAATFTGSLTVQGALSGTTGTFSGLVTGGTGYLGGGAAYAGEAGIALRNTNATSGVDFVLHSDGVNYGILNRSLGAWSLNFQYGTNAFNFSGSGSVNGNLNVVGTLSKSGTQVALQSTTIAGATSITGGGDLSANRTLTLLNDVASPGTSWYYGTNSSGTKGWFALSSVVGVPEAPIDGVTYARKDASWVSLGSGGAQYVLKTGDTMTGQLNLSYPTASLHLNNTAAAADTKLWSFSAGSAGFYLDSWNDAQTLFDSAMTFVRSAQTITNFTIGTTNTNTAKLKSSITTFGQSTSDFTGPYGAPIRAGVVYSGVCEIGVNSADGTNNPRSSLWANGAAGTIGLDWAYSSGVTKFQFLRAGAEVFNYNENGIAVVAGKSAVFYKPDNSEAGTISYSSGGHLTLYGVSGILLNPGGATTLSVVPASVDVYAGKLLRMFDTGNSNLTSLHQNGTVFDVSIPTGGQLRIIEQGVSRMAVAAGSTILGAGAYLGVVSTDTGSAGRMSMSNTGVLTFNTTAGTSLAWQIGGADYMVQSASTLTLTQNLTLSGTGKAIYIDTSCGLTQAQSSTRKGLLARDANGWRGGVAYWNDAAWQSGNMQSGTATPAATGVPGDLFFVYE